MFNIATFQEILLPSSDNVDGMSYTIKGNMWTCNFPEYFDTF